MRSVLSGVRVLDLGRYIAGPFCASLLGDLGADVIRVEKVEGSEDRYVYALSEGGEGTLFLQMNRNKRSLALDIASEEGRAVIRRLVAESDVVVVNLPHKMLVSLGLDYDSLRAIKPDIILTMASGFGSKGPYSDRLGFDGVGQAMSGGVWLSGFEDCPIKANVPFVDYGTALACAFGTLAALLERQTSGEGQVVEGALFTTALTMCGPLLSEQAVLEPDRKATGNRSQIAGPSDIFKTQDGWIIVQVVGKPLFERWARLMGDAGAWLGDPRFADDSRRGDNGEVLSEKMSEWCAARTTDEALGELEAARIPAGPVLSPRQVLSDPHTRQAGLMEAWPCRGQDKPVPLMRTIAELSRTPGRIRTAPPALGEHSEEILEELGYTSADIAQLRSAGVVA